MTKSERHYKEGILLQCSVNLCLLEIIFVYVLAEFASVQTSGDTHQKISPRSGLAADNITHLTDKIVLLHQIFFYYYNKIFCWSDWKLVPISIWWRWCYLFMLFNSISAFKEYKILKHPGLSVRSYKDF